MSKIDPAARRAAWAVLVDYFLQRLRERKDPPAIIAGYNFLLREEGRHKRYPRFVVAHAVNDANRAFAEARARFNREQEIGTVPRTAPPRF